MCRTFVRQEQNRIPQSSKGLPRAILQQIQNISDDVIMLRKKRLDRGGVMRNQICQCMCNQALQETANKNLTDEKMIPWC